MYQLKSVCCENVAYILCVLVNQTFFGHEIAILIKYSIFDFSFFRNFKVDQTGEFQ